MHVNPLIAGVIGLVKSRQSSAAQAMEFNPSSVDTQNGTVYGPLAWSEFGKKFKCTLEIVGKVPPAPEEPVAEGMIRLYIPEQVRVNGEVKAFNLNTWCEIAANQFSYLDDSVKSKFGEDTASGWIDIDRAVMEASRKQHYVDQKEMVKERGDGYRLPHLLEAVVLTQMVLTFKEERLFERTRTRCEEMVKELHPVVVGFDFHGLEVLGDIFDVIDHIGVAAVREFC